MNILIVDQCSGSKDYPESFETFSEGDIDGSRDSILEDLDHEGIEANNLYTGIQQRRINSATRQLRNNGHGVDRFFISAGFGLIAEDERLPPYDVTFDHMSPKEIKSRSQELGITDELCELVENHSTYDIIFLPLGNNYYHAIDLDRLFESIPNSSITVVFNREEDLLEANNVVLLEARLPQAKNFGATVIAVKGEMILRFAQNVGSDFSASPNEVRGLCLQNDTNQSEISQYE